jgi:hypothetical protein
VAGDVILSVPRNRTIPSQGKGDPLIVYAANNQEDFIYFWLCE